MSWADSLIKLSGYEVEVLQKRLAEIADRRQAVDMRIAMLEAEAEHEAQHAREDAQNGWYQVGFLEGVRIRRAALQYEAEQIMMEEAGARDALAQAFEEQKKYEQVADNMRIARDKVVARMEIAAMDELGLRRAAAGR